MKSSPPTPFAGIKLAVRIVCSIRDRWNPPPWSTVGCPLGLYATDRVETSSEQESPMRFPGEQKANFILRIRSLNRVRPMVACFSAVRPPTDLGPSGPLGTARRPSPRTAKNTRLLCVEDSFWEIRRGERCLETAVAPVVYVVPPYSFNRASALSPGAYPIGVSPLTVRALTSAPASINRRTISK